MLGRGALKAPLTPPNFDAQNRVIRPISTGVRAPAATYQIVVDRGGRQGRQGRQGPIDWGRQGPVDCAQALEDRVGPPYLSLYQRYYRSRYRGGFLFGPGLAPGAPGTYSTRPGLPRAGCLAIWPGAPGASPGPPGPKKKLFQICRRSIEIINSSLIPFYILTIDFILGLPLNKARENYIILVIYKFSKLLTLITSKIIFSI